MTQDILISFFCDLSLGGGEETFARHPPAELRWAESLGCDVPLAGRCA